MTGFASRDKQPLSKIAIIDQAVIDQMTAGLDIPGVVADYLTANPPSGGLTIDQIKADTTIADAISKKHANTSDHAKNTDTDLDSTFETSLKNVDNHASGTTNKVFTAVEQTKLSGIATSATAGADWNTNVSNKPTIPAAQVNSDWNSSTGLSQISNKPSIPAAQIQTDWNASTGIGVLLNKPTMTGSNTGDETAARIAALITGAGAQTTPLDADEFPFYKIVGTVLSKVTWANVKATLSSYFTGLYNPIRLRINLSAPAVSSGTTEKVLLSLLIPAARAGTGSTFRCMMTGNSSSTGTLIFKIRSGASGTITDAIDWTAVTSVAQVANARAGFDCLVTVRSATTIAANGVGYAGAVQLPTVIAVPATPAIVVSAPWYINLTVICSSGTFTCQVGSIEEIR